MIASKHEDDIIAQPGSISILKEHKLAKSIIYIVKYMNLQQQQIYACLLIRQTEANSWEFANFLMMGGTPNMDLSQKPSPQIAWSRFSDSRGSFTSLGVVVFPNEVQITAWYVSKIVMDLSLQVSWKMTQHSLSPLKYFINHCL